MKNWKIAGLIATIIIVIIIPFSVLKQTSTKKTEEAPFQFVGSESCMECHTNEFKSWQKSHHAHAMAVASEESVLGNFSNIAYNDGDHTHRFFMKDGKYFVNTVGPDGNMADFEITHTFGYTPLQQYLIPFERGKYQCLHIAWDTEKKQWFNMSKMIYGEDIHHNDWLHWTNQAQNWNGMCAECHSTNLKKNYFHEADSFHTTFSEIHVGCESCHGPGSEHLKWAWLPENSRPSSTNFGLQVQTSSVSTEQYVELCARCHSRRGQVTDFDHSFKNIFDYMLPTNLNESYHPDGQIFDEDYVFGSYTQSKMYHTDIKCNDCHDVHSGERYFDGNQLCFQCHAQDYYGSKSHHFHKNEGEQGAPLNIDGKIVNVGEGAQCINCHMPAQLYMGIDSRNDHSIRIPRPDLSDKLGTPNACNQCHTDKSTKWATEYFTKWYGVKRKPHYGEVIALAREQKPEAEPRLISLINDTLSPKIVRATCIDLLSHYNSDTAFLTIQNYLDDPSPILRHAAIRGFNSNNLNSFLENAAPLLNDPHRVIRGQAAMKLSNVPIEQMPQKYLKDYQNALEEYKKNNEYMADFPSARMNLGIMYANTKQNSKAKENYKKAIETDSAFFPAKLNLAIIHNRLGENSEAEKIYKRIIKDNPDFNGVYFSLGLLLAEQKKYRESVKYLEIAVQKTPENTRIYYNLSLIYQHIGEPLKAEQQLKKAIELEPENFDFIYALCHLYTTQNNFKQAYKLGQQMKSLFPDNPTGIQLINHINRQMNQKGS